jgi:hypothetical protein|tara:strand:+ start:730 stop:1104 length:375 start_codon:yes stop_codon:yes gene_type:complete
MTTGVSTRLAFDVPYRLANKLHSITTSTTSTEMSEAVGSGIDAVMITSTEDAYLAFGGEVSNVAWSEVSGAWSAQTNTWKEYEPTGEGYQEKDWPTYWRISSGQKVSALQVSASGTVYIAEMTR